MSDKRVLVRVPPFDMFSGVTIYRNGRFTIWANEKGTKLASGDGTRGTWELDHKEKAVKALPDGYQEMDSVWWREDAGDFTYKMIVEALLNLEIENMLMKG